MTERENREVVDTGKRLHVVTTRDMTLCGFRAAPADRYDTPDAGWRVWFAQRERHCTHCVTVYCKEIRAATEEMFAGHTNNNVAAPLATAGHAPHEEIAHECFTE